MEDRYDISVDIGDGKSYSVATLFENGEYRPIAVCDTISFGSDVDHYALRALFDLDFVRDMTNALLSYSVDTCGRRRKTTYKTIRRDCAKRNKHK